MEYFTLNALTVQDNCPLLVPWISQFCFILACVQEAYAATSQLLNAQRSHVRQTQSWMLAVFVCILVGSWWFGCFISAIVLMHDNKTRTDSSSRMCFWVAVLQETMSYFVKFSDLKENSSHPLLCEKKCLLPTYPSHYLLCSSFRHPSSVIRSITQSITLYTCPAICLMIFVCPQCPKTWVSFWGKRARLCLFQILMAGFRQEPFFLLSSKGHDRGQRSEGLGLVAKEESTNKEKPPVLIGQGKRQICRPDSEFQRPARKSGTIGEEASVDEWQVV